MAAQSNTTVKRFQRIIRWFEDPTRTIAVLGSLLPLIFLIGFIARYGSHVVMVDDTLGLVVPIVIAAETNSLTLADVFTLWNGHRHVMTILTSLLIARITNWNLYYEYAVATVTALGSIVLLLTLHARTERPRLHWYLFPLSVLFLSPHLGIVWTSSLYTLWHYNVFFSLLLVTLLIYMHPSWRKIVVANVVAIFTLLSMGGGVAAWVVIIAYLLLTPSERRPAYLVSTIIVGALAVLLYTGGGDAVGVSNDEGTNLNTLSLFSPLQVVEYIAAVLGGPLAAERTALAITNTAIAGGLLILNSIYLIREERWPTVKPWLLATIYAVVVSGLIALSRYDLGVHVALQERYNTIGLIAWAALLALVLTALPIAHKASGIMPRLLVNVNLLALVWIGGLYAFSVQTTTNTLKGEITVDDHLALLHCYETYPIRQLENCDEDWRAEPYDIMAALNLTAYQDAPRANILAPDYQPGDAVVIRTDDAWYAVHVRDRLLAGVPADEVFMRVGDTSSVEPYLPHLPVPVHHISTWDAPTNDTPLMNASQPLWLVERAVWEQSLPDTSTSIHEGYAQQFVYELQDGNNAARYLPLPAQPNTDIIYGDTLNLRHVDTPITSVTACGGVPLRTFWGTTAPVRDDLRITATLTDAKGRRLRAPIPPQQSLSSTGIATTPTPTNASSPCPAIPPPETTTS